MVRHRRARERVFKGGPRTHNFCRGAQNEGFFFFWLGVEWPAFPWETLGTCLHLASLRSPCLGNKDNSTSLEGHGEITETVNSVL